MAKGVFCCEIISLLIIFSLLLPFQILIPYLIILKPTKLGFISLHFCYMHKLELINWISFPLSSFPFSFSFLKTLNKSLSESQYCCQWNEAKCWGKVQGFFVFLWVLYSSWLEEKQILLILRKCFCFVLVPPSTATDTALAMHLLCVYSPEVIKIIIIFWNSGGSTEKGSTLSVYQV